MNKGAFIFAFVLCVSLAVKGGPFSSDEAHALYEKHFRHTPPSVQECGGYLFVIVEGEVSKGSRDNASKDILEAQMGALEKYVGSGTFGYVSPFSGKLTDRLRPKGGFEIDSCRAVCVEENVAGNRFREVSAFETGPIKAERSRLLQKKPSRRSVAAWVTDLSNLIKKCSAKKMRMHVMTEAGLFIPVFFGPEHSSRCIDVTVDGVAVEKLFREWGSGSKTEMECESALRVLPTFSSAHQRLAELAFDRGDKTEAVDRWINAGIAGKSDEARLTSALDELSGTTGSDVWRELGTLRRRCLKCGFSMSEKGEAGCRIANSVCKSFGRIAFVNVADETAERMYLKAEELFKKGKNLPQIIADLEGAIVRNPGLADVWKLYADALRTDGRYEAAVLAYHEAICCDTKDVEAIYGLARCYEFMGFKNLAASAAWWGLLSAPDDVRREGLVSLLKRIYPDVFL